MTTSTQAGLVGLQSFCWLSLMKIIGLDSYHLVKETILGLRDILAVQGRFDG